MSQCANDNMSFVRTETFIQIMSKLDKELQVHVKSWPMPQFITVRSLECVGWYELGSPPCYWEVVDKSGRATNDSVQRRELKTKRKQKCFRFHNNLHRELRVRHRKQGRLVTKSPGCGSLAKYDSTRLEGVQLQDEHAPLEVRVLRHEDAALGSNLKMTPKAVLHSLVRLGAHKR